MRPVVIPAAALAAAVAVLAACSPGGGAPPSVPPVPSSPVSTAPAPPPDPEPVADGPCPYLENGFVAQANGQRVSKVRTSADKPHPACFFYALNGKPQLTVRVYTGDPVVAKALVDKAAPVNTSNPADEPPGWQGGSQATDGGAVYAVAKQGTAVVVTTNQRQTVKARTVAKQAVSALAL
ncbi:DUF2020 domain-containing protein [Amycolatopsis anabasis]|uniref:DUF2020 domain-containing protein n=1 Tax=Amycolatopsis anabasis TaxID=1840409 RepID=UPI00131BE2F2|nr:DUF2020 domain-containing protein [Amycolatopsis anabasis]